MMNFLSKRHTITTMVPCALAFWLCEKLGNRFFFLNKSNLVLESFIPGSFGI